MKTFAKQLVLFGLLFTGSLLCAQEQNRYTFYRQHMNILDPSFAGADGNTRFAGIFRSQWQGVEDAPESQAFSFGTPVGNRVGLGVSVENQKTHIEKQLRVNVDFSYALPVREDLMLYLGVKAGGDFYDVNTSGLQLWNYEADPSLVGLSRINPNVGVGAHLRHERFYVSLSAPRILETQKATEAEGLVTTAADKVYYYLSGGYDLPLSADVVLKPSVLMRYVNGEPITADLTALLSLYGDFELGAAYRTDKAFSGLALVQVLKGFDLGYAYESSLRSQLQHVSNGTHELFVRFTL